MHHKIFFFSVEYLKKGRQNLMGETNKLYYHKRNDNGKNIALPMITRQQIILTKKEIPLLVNQKHIFSWAT